MILCISNVIGTMTPPVAVNIFSAVQVTRSVRELKIGDIAKAELPFFKARLSTKQEGAGHDD